MCFFVKTKKIQTKNIYILCTNVEVKEKLVKYIPQRRWSHEQGQGAFMSFKAPPIERQK